MLACACAAVLAADPAAADDAGAAPGEGATSASAAKVLLPQGPQVSKVSLSTGNIAHRAVRPPSPSCHCCVLQVGATTVMQGVCIRMSTRVPADRAYVLYLPA